MKLLHCRKCKDIVAMYREERKCLCGESSGRYVDHINLEYSGDRAVILGIDNADFLMTLVKFDVFAERADGLGRRFEAFVIPKSAKSVKKRRG